MIAARLLGRFDVRADGLVVIDDAWPRSKARALFKLLALEPGRRVRRDELIDALWPDLDPAAAANNFHKNVHYLRAAFTAGGLSDAFTVTDEAATLCDRVQVDVDAFRDAARIARTARTDPSAYVVALDLYAGDLAVDDLDLPRVERLRSDLAELHAQLLFELGELYLLRGRHDEAVERLRELTTIDPAHEEAHRLLMRTYAATGRRERALRQYARCEAALRDEFGVPPLPETRALHAEIVDGWTGAHPGERVAAALCAGRTREMDALRDLLARAREGQGGVAVVGGEPGIGKTTLAQEFALYAGLCGAAVAWASCSEDDDAPPFLPWIEVLRQTGGTDGASGDLAALGRGAATTATPGADAPGEHARQRLFSAVTSFLQARARTQPVLIVLDDLHGAQELDLLLLQYIAQHIGRTRIAVLACYRNAGLRRPLAPTFAELARGSRHQRHELARLTSQEVGRVATEALGPRATPALVSTLVATTEGHPLFLREALRLVGAGPVDGAGEQIAVPASVRDVIAARLALTSPRCRDALGVAAVIGRDFSVDLLARTAGYGGSETVARLDEAEAARIVARTRAPGGYAFTHALLREALYDGLEARERSTLHRHIGEALEAAHPDETASVAARLAYHFGQAAHAGHRGVVAKATGYMREAGDRAMEITAYDEARGYYTRALELMRLCDVPDDAARCDVLIGLGRAQFCLGDSDGARATLQRCAALARRLHLGDRLMGLAIHLAGPWVRPFVDDLMVGILEDALSLLPPGDTPSRAWALARLGFELLSGPEEDRAVALIHEAAGVARRTGDPAAIAISIDKLLNVTADAADLGARLALVDEMREQAQRAASPELVLISRLWRFDLLLQTGDTDAAWSEQATFEAEAGRLQQRSFLWIAATFRVLRATFDGRLDDAEALLRDASAAGQRAAAPDLAVVAGTQLLLLRYEQGRLDEMLPLVAPAAAEAGALPGVIAGLALIHARAGRLDEARAAAAPLTAEGCAAVRSRGRRLDLLIAIAFLGDVLAVTGDAAAASALYEMLLPRRATNITLPNGNAFMGPAARTLAQLAATAGCWEAAAAHFEDALASAERCGAATWLARTQVDYAEAIAASRGRLPALRSPDELLALAGAAARGSGGADLLRRIKRLAAAEDRGGPASGLRAGERPHGRPA